MTVNVDRRTGPDFTVRFDGPALAQHRMDVRELAPALLALADVFQDVNAALHGADGPPVSLNIKATGAGSFAVDLSPVLDVVGYTIDMFASDEATAAATLTTFVATGVGVFSFFKNKRKAKREEVLPGGGVTFELEDGSSITYAADVRRLAEIPRIQRDVRKVVLPLARTGIDVVQFKEPGATEPMLEVHAADLPAFMGSETAEEDSDALTSFREVRLRVDKPSFTTPKWKVHDGAAPYWVTVEDEDVLDRTLLSRLKPGSPREPFSAGDTVRVVERTVQSVGDDGTLKVERFIVEVLERITPPVQRTTDDGSPT